MSRGEGGCLSAGLGAGRGRRKAAGCAQTGGAAPPRPRNRPWQTCRRGRGLADRRRCTLAWSAGSAGRGLQQERRVNWCTAHPLSQRTQRGGKVARAADGRAAGLSHDCLSCTPYQEERHSTAAPACRRHAAPPPATTLHPTHPLHQMGTVPLLRSTFSVSKVHTCRRFTYHSIATSCLCTTSLQRPAACCKRGTLRKAPPGNASCVGHCLEFSADVVWEGAGRQASKQKKRR